MNFGTAVSTCLSKYVVFTGRARRSEYWWFFLFNFLVSLVASLVDRAIGGPVLQIIVALALLLPGIAVGIRRLHDTGRVGWWLFIALIPLIGAIVLLVFFCSDSQPGANQYGPSPKEIAGGGYPPAAGGYQPPPAY